MSSADEVDSMDEMRTRLTPDITSMDRAGIKHAIKEGLYALNGASGIVQVERFPSERNEEAQSAFRSLSIGAECIFDDRIVQFYYDELDSIRTKIDYLKSQYPDDPDLEFLERLHDDLRGDLEVDRPMELDTGFDEIMETVMREIHDSGVKRESPDESENPLVARLRELGIEPAYVVSNNRSSEKTVVVFMQSHPNPGMSQRLLRAFGVKKSQDKIYRDILAAYRGGLKPIIYGEGYPGEMEFSRDFADADLKRDRKNEELSLSYVRVKKKLGDKVKLVGMEDMGLLEIIYRGSAVAKYRITANNILLADNIDEHFRQTDESLAFAVIGAAHENFPLLPSSNPMPLSYALAYYGYNVVVVDDSSPYLDQEALKKLTGK